MSCITGIELIREWALDEGYDHSEVRVCLMDTLHYCGLDLVRGVSCVEVDEERMHRPTIIIGNIRIFFLYGRYYVSRNGRQCFDSPIDIEDPEFFSRLRRLMVELI